MDITGLTRLSYMSGDPMLQEMEASGCYSKEEMKIVKAIYNRKQVTKAFFNEINALAENARLLYDIKLPADKPILFILSDNSCKQMKKEFSKRGYDATWEGLHEEVISNPDIQKIKYLEGQHYLHWTQSDRIADMTKEFLQEYLH
jgi:hypothetical protein